MKKTSCIVPLIVVFMVIQNIATGLAASPNATPPERPGIIIPKEGLNEWERHFLKCLQPLALVDLENSSVRGVTPSLRRFFIKLHDLDLANPNVRRANVTIEYDVRGKRPDLLENVRLTQFKVAYRGEATLAVRLGSAFHPYTWHSVEYTCSVDEEGNFIPPGPFRGRPESTGKKTIHVACHANGRVEKLLYFGAVDGVPHLVDHSAKWDEDGNVTGRAKYDVPQPITFIKTPRPDPSKER